MQKVMAAIVHYRICIPDGNDKARNFCCGAHSLVPHPQETSICKNSNRQYGPKHNTVVALMLQLLLTAHFPDTLVLQNISSTVEQGDSLGGNKQLHS